MGVTFTVVVINGGGGCHVMVVMAMVDGGGGCHVGVVFIVINGGGGQHVIIDDAVVVVVAEGAVGGHCQLCTYLGCSSVLLTFVLLLQSMRDLEKI